MRAARWSSIEPRRHAYRSSPATLVRRHNSDAATNDRKQRVRATDWISYRFSIRSPCTIRTTRRPGTSDQRYAFRNNHAASTAPDRPVEIQSFKHFEPGTRGSGDCEMQVRNGGALRTQGRAWRPPVTKLSAIAADCASGNGRSDQGATPEPLPEEIQQGSRRCPLMLP